MEFRDAVAGLLRGDFSRLAPLFKGKRPQIVEWVGSGRFNDEPRALAEALACACFLGRTEVAELLLERGVDPAAGNGTGLDAFHWAVNRGQLEVVHLLLRHHARLGTRSMYGATVLGTALWSASNEPHGDHLEIIEQLLKAGAGLVPDATATEKSGRPADGEFADYAADDIAYVQGDDAIAALRHQEKEVIAFLAAISDERARGLTYAAGKWTLKEVIGHMIDDERIFAYRMLCVARKEPLPLPGFDEKVYVAASDFEQRTVASFVTEYRTVRAATIALSESFSLETWKRRGVVNGYEASVRGLAFHVAGHELHHLRILRDRYLPDRGGAPQAQSPSELTE